MTAKGTVLVSGGGIAGSTLAYWLARHGFRVTVVERAAGLRSSGSPVDVRGPAVVVAERTGVPEAVRAAGAGSTGITFVDADGRPTGRVDTEALRQASRSRETEIPRGDLAAILYGAAQGCAEFLFGDSITALAQDPDGVDVTFERAAPRRYERAHRRLVDPRQRNAGRAAAPLVPATWRASAPATGPPGSGPPSPPSPGSVPASGAAPPLRPTGKWGAASRRPGSRPAGFSSVAAAPLLLPRRHRPDSARRDARALARPASPRSPQLRCYSLVGTARTRP